MRIDKKSLVMTAVFTGLLGGTMARINATPTFSGSSVTLAGEMSGATDDKKDKNSCIGKNSCKGTGGCKVSDNGCKGKNSCKGKGGCATDGSLTKKQRDKLQADKKAADQKKMQDEKKPQD